MAQEDLGYLMAKPEIEDISGNTELIREMRDYFIEKGIEGWLNEHPDTTQVDMFMAAHNFHKYVVMMVATLWEENIPKNRTYRLADMTFRDAMKELSRDYQNQKALAAHPR